MSNFQIHTQESAPSGSQALLAGAEKAFGFVPNLLGVFAESPAVLEAYLSLSGLLDKSSFSPTERQVAILAISRFNECHYCVAAHSVIAGMQNVPADVVDAIRNDEAIGDARLQALRVFATAAVEKRGWLSDEDVAAFVEAGYTQAQVLEVILAISFKTLSNYVNHVADTSLDAAFASQAWQPVDQAVKAAS